MTGRLQRPSPEHGRRAVWLGTGVLVVTFGILVGLSAPGPTTRMRGETETDGPLIRVARPAEVASPPVATRIAFTGPELLKMEWGAPAFVVGDVNGDGLLDILSINPAKARIECFLQRPPGQPAAAETPESGSETDDVNVLADDPGFERRPLAVEHRVFSLLSADFTGDGRDDLAYYGEPNKLILVEQTAEGTWGARHTFELPDGSRNPGGLVAGDFDGDGRTDIALVGRNVLHLLCHEEDGQLAPAKKVPASAEGSGFLLVGDFDGNGRQDLAYPVAQQETPLCFRLQDDDGNLGPEQFAEVPRFRAVATVRRADDARAALGFILAASGRLELRRLAVREEKGAPARAGELLVYPLEEDKSERRLLVCDLDGDDRLDVVATYPSTAQVGVLFQREGGRLRQPSLYPSLSGISEATTGDLDGDGRPELVVLSKEEETIGYSRWRGSTGSARPEPVEGRTSEAGTGRLDFPRAVPLVGRPQAVATGDVNGDGRDEIVYVRKEEKTYYLAWRGLDESDGFTEEQAVELEGLDTDVSGLLASDLTGDGHLDVLVLLSFGPARLLLGDGEGQLRQAGSEGAFSRGLFRRLSPGSVSLGDIDDDGRLELLIAEKNFARAVTIGPDGSPSVVEQANGKSARSQIASAAVADLEGDGVAEVILLDSWAKELTVLRRLADGTLGEPRSISLGGLPLQKARVVAGELTGDGRTDLIVLSQAGVGLVPLGVAGHQFELLADYESDTEKANLADLVAGDLFADGSEEVLAIDIRNHNLELLRWEETSNLRRIYRFTVFEKKVFRGRERGGNEPRQALLADVTGDGRTDIVLLVHDRIVLYPQIVPEDRDSTGADAEVAGGNESPSAQKGGEE